MRATLLLHTLGLRARFKGRVFRSFVLTHLSDGESNGIAKTRCNSSTAFDVTSMVAAQVLENPVVDALRPGIRFLEILHNSTGLPWWATITGTMLCARLVTLPSSMYAKDASANLFLISRSVKDSQHVMDTIGSLTSATDKYAVASTIYRHYQRQAGVPSFAWYCLNVSVQIPFFLYLSFSLKHMCFELWPGLQKEGLPFFVDLTLPSVVLSDYSTPYGTAGAVFPLLLVLSYASSLEKAAATANPGLGVLLKLVTIPYYCLSLIQPQAVLLVWLTNQAFIQFFQSKLHSEKFDKIATDFVDQANSAESVASAEKLLKDVTFLVALGDRLSKKGELAKRCYSRALEIQPDSATALSHLALVQADTGDLVAAAETYITSAQAATDDAIKGDSYLQASLLYIQQASSICDFDPQLKLELWQKASAAAQSACQSAAMNPRAWYTLALSYCALSQPELALPAAESAMELSLKNKEVKSALSTVFFTLAKMYKAHGNAELALELGLKALRMDKEAAGMTLALALEKDTRRLEMEVFLELLRESKDIIKTREIVK